MENNQIPKISWLEFLKDVLVCSFGAYGGPEAHFGMFAHQMVEKKNYLTADELIEFKALTAILPGPSSTQTITAIGYKMGGPKLALLTLLVWSFPSIMIMTLLSFLYTYVAGSSFNFDIFKYIGPMAIAFIWMASLTIGKKVIKNYFAVILLVISFGVSLFFREFWVFPVLLIVGGILGALLFKHQQEKVVVSIKPPWIYLGLTVAIAVISVVLNQLFINRLLFIFDHFYRYGYLVIGGGQVVVPYMYSDLVEVLGYLSTSEFLTGFGIVQGVPGPMFGFSSFAGGMAYRDGGVLLQAISAILASLAIFLPGTLLIFFVIPIWSDLKKIHWFQNALKGVGPVAIGLIASSGFVLLNSIGYQWDYLLVIGLVFFILWTKKIPAPLIVLSVILAGYLLTIL